VDFSDKRRMPEVRDFIRMAKNLRDADLAAMANPNRIVIPGPVGKEGILLQCGYPLSKLCSFRVRSHDPSRGFTRMDMARAALKIYDHIYEVEAKTMTKTEDPIILPYCTAQPRPVSNGKYGIWGYDIQYLVLESIVYDDLTDTWNVVPCVEQPGS